MYCSPAELEQSIPRNTLIQLSSDDPTASDPDGGVVNDALQFAGELIDAHLRGRYTLPLQEVPTVVRDMARTLARYWLYSRRPEGDLPEVVKDSYRVTVKTLENIRDNKLTLGITTTQTDMPESGEFRVSAPRARFSGRGGLLEKFR
ncbi:DUF1320 domain-containing protein [Citrobacter portucalensis]|uniref:gp436 family protein n=1 Tax=Citrobacter portucalensis TaxID=1639133 RepID=UPI00226B848B|nr:DUF1320 domain-containing protein [Citrobacter portucalensis]MCX9038486.1 DUF1320 domain-containing protein [Citrobacter portucalensis]